MPKTVTADKASPLPDDDKPITTVVTEPVETKHTLRQVRQERDIAKAMLDQAKLQLDRAQAKVDEAKKALA